MRYANISSRVRNGVLLAAMALLVAACGGGDDGDDASSDPSSNNGSQDGGQTDTGDGDGNNNDSDDGGNGNDGYDGSDDDGPSVDLETQTVEQYGNWTPTGYQKGIETETGGNKKLTWRVTQDTVDRQHTPYYRGFHKVLPGRIKEIAFDYHVNGTPEGNVRLEIWDGLARHRIWTQAIDSTDQTSVKLTDVDSLNGLEFRLAPNAKELRPNVVVRVEDVEVKHTPSTSELEDEVEQQRQAMAERFVERHKARMAYQPLPHPALPFGEGTKDDSAIEVVERPGVDDRQPGWLGGEFSLFHRDDLIRFKGSGYIMIRWENEYWIHDGRMDLPRVEGDIVPIGENDGFLDADGNMWPMIGPTNKWYYMHGEAVIQVKERTDFSASYNLGVERKHYGAPRPSVFAPTASTLVF